MAAIAALDAEASQGEHNAAADDRMRKLRLVVGLCILKPFISMEQKAEVLSSLWR